MLIKLIKLDKIIILTKVLVSHSHKFKIITNLCYNSHKLYSDWETIWILNNNNKTLSRINKFKIYNKVKTILILLLKILIANNNFKIKSMY